MSGTLELDVTAPVDDGGFSARVELSSSALDGGALAVQVGVGVNDLTAAAGTYDVLAGPGALPDPIVSIGFLGTVGGSPATVVSGQTQVVTVDYAQLGGTGMVWVPNVTDGNIYGFTSATLTAGNPSPAPDVLLSTDAGSGAQVVVFDRSGQLWAATGQGQLWGWRLFADGGASDPTIVVTLQDDGGVLALQSATFAPSGDLWLVTQDNALAVLPPSQLAQSGSVTPGLLGGNPIGLSDGGAFPSLDIPYGVVFDGIGGIWVANIGSSQPGTLARFSLVPDGGFDPTATAYLFSTQGIFSGPNGLSFDAQGNLWVADYARGALLRFNVSSLSGVVDAQPDATLTTADGGAYAPFDQPDYVTFDNSGALWVYNQSDGSLERFTDPLSYSGTVNPQPDVVLLLNYGGDTGKFQFDLPAPGLGLYP